MTGETVSHYRILEKLGEGGMGIVYRAEDLKLHRSVALKFIGPHALDDAQSKERFLREARTAASLDHPNVCTIYEIGEANGQTFLSMAFIEGQTVKAKIAQRPLKLEEALSVAIQAGEGLQAAHKKGIIHRDIKSSNLMVTPEWQVKVMDFGLAQLAGQSALTKTRTTMGTAEYMSPEQAQCQPLDRRTDIWSLGVVLYEMLSGRRPFEGEHEAAVLYAIIHAAAEPVTALRSGIPAALDRVLDKAMAKDPKHRYQHVADLLVDLRALMKGQPVSAPDRIRRRKLLIGFVGSGTAGLVAIGVASRLWWPQELPSSRAKPSLVALPAQVIGPEEFQYLADALPSTLSTHLSRIEALETKVPPSRAEVESVKGDIARIGSAYGVQYCLRSTITVEGNRTIVNVMLVDPKTRQVVWSHEYPGQRNQYVELLAQAADDIRKKLRPNSSPFQLSAAQLPASEVELALRRAEHFAERYNNLHQQADFDVASEFYQQALKLDSRLADAASGLARLLRFRIEAGASSTEETLPEAEMWDRRALEIDPRHGRAWGGLTFGEARHPRASRARILEPALRAAAFAPGDFLTYAALMEGFWHGLGSVSLAMDAAAQSHQLRPLYLYPPINMAVFLNSLGRPSEGLPLVDYSLSIEPELPWGLWVKSLLLADLGRLEEADRLISRVEPMVAEKRVPGFMLLRAQYPLALRKGDPVEAAQALQRIVNFINDPRTATDPRDHLLMELVTLLVRDNQTDEALRHLGRAAELGALLPYDWLLWNPHLAKIRATPQFKQVLAGSRSHFEQSLGIIEQAKARGEFPEAMTKPLSDLLAKLGMSRRL